MSERRSPAPELQSVAAVSSPPIACNIEAIPAADRPRYRSLRDLVFQLVEHVAENPDGYALRLRNESDTPARLAEWIALERLCCPFLRFAITVDGGDRLGLSLSGDAGVKEFLRLELTGGLLAPESLVTPGR